MHPSSAGGNFGFRGVYKKQTSSVRRGAAGTQLTAQMGGDGLFVRKNELKKDEKEGEKKKKEQLENSFSWRLCGEGCFYQPGWVGGKTGSVRRECSKESWATGARSQTFPTLLAFGGLKWEQRLTGQSLQVGQGATSAGRCQKGTRCVREVPGCGQEMPGSRVTHPGDAMAQPGSSG